MENFEEIEAFLAAEGFSPGRNANLKLAELLGEETGVGGAVRDFCGDESLCVELLSTFPSVSDIEVIGESGAWVALFANHGFQFVTESFPKRSQAAAAALFSVLTDK